MIKVVFCIKVIMDEDLIYKPQEIEKQIG